MESQFLNVTNVKYCGGDQIVVMGRLFSKERKIFFEYDAGFLATGLELSPFKLPLNPGIIACKDRVFEGLFGVFNDSLPDGWGKLLLDRKLMRAGIQPGALNPLERLRYVGTRGMGALQYEPEIVNNIALSHSIDLDLIAEECISINEIESNVFVDDLLIMNGSSAGARPKILVRLLKNLECFEISQNKAAPVGSDWIIKFRSSFDPQDIGPIEFAYHLMAKDAGLNVPQAKLFQSKKCAGYFGVQRFDHVQGKFFHMHTMSGLLHADHRIPSLDYESVIRATQYLTKDLQQCEIQFRNVVFNIFAHNRDDHAKNFSFLMDEKGVWKVSPAYDLTFSYGPAGEHCTTIMGEGKNPGVSHLLALAKIGGIQTKNAKNIIQQVEAAVSKWSIFAKEAQVGNQSTKNIQSVLMSTSSLLK